MQLRWIATIDAKAPIQCLHTTELISNDHSTIVSRICATAIQLLTLN